MKTAILGASSRWAKAFHLPVANPLARSGNTSNIMPSVIAYKVGTNTEEPRSLELRHKLLADVFGKGMHQAIKAIITRRGSQYR